MMMMHRYLWKSYQAEQSPGNSGCIYPHNTSISTSIYMYTEPYTYICMHIPTHQYTNTHTDAHSYTYSIHTLIFLRDKIETWRQVTDWMLWSSTALLQGLSAQLWRPAQSPIWVDREDLMGLQWCRCWDLSVSMWGWRLLSSRLSKVSRGRT